MFFFLISKGQGTGESFHNYNLQCTHESQKNIHYIYIYYWETEVDEKI